MATEGQLTKLEDIRDYVLGGHARFTLVSKKTGERKTFRVRTTPDNFKHKETNSSAWFVDLLVGPNNSDDYKYLGFLYDVQHKLPQLQGLRFRQNKETWGPEAFATFSWLVRQLNAVTLHAHADGDFNSRAEFWHLGTCARCGRDLTTPESIARGIGPVCAGAV